MAKNSTGERPPSTHSGVYADAGLSFAATFIENSSELVAAIDRNLTFVAINGAFRREWELVFGRILRLGDRLDEALEHLTSDRDKAVSLSRRALAGETFCVSEEFGDNQLLRKYYDLTFTPVLDSRQQPIFFALVVRDLSMERIAEKRFGPLLEVSPDATIIARADGRIDIANSLAERMFGYERHQMNGLRIEDLVPERFRARHVAQRNRFSLKPSMRPMGGGKTELYGLRRDGTEFPVEISLNPLNASGEQMIVAAIRDMTTRQQTEDELRTLSVELERRVAARTLELEEATRAFRDTFEHASVGIAHVDLHGQWLRVNDNLCQILGYEKEELSSMSFQHITHPDDVDADVRQMYRLVAGDIGSYTMDKRYVHKNGAIVWANLNVSLVRNQHGVPEYFISVIKDISDRKAAETALRKSKESLELAISATDIGMFDRDPRTGRNLWNDQFRRHMGLPEGAVIHYKDILEWMHPEDRSRVDALVDSVLKPELGDHFQTQFRAIGLTDKRERWIEVRSKAYFDDLGQPTRLIVTTLDITEKKRSEEAIRQSEQQLRRMFNAIPIGTVRGTLKGEVSEANPAYLRMIGRTRADLEARVIRWDDLTPQEHLTKDVDAIEQARREGVSRLYEKEYLRQDGTRVPILMACATLGDENDLVAFVLDISERKNAEERVRHTLLHDQLTGLPNRALLFDYARHVLARARRSNRHCAALFVDLDRFKPINDSHGHRIGDQVLKEVSRRLTASIRADDIAFRLGGDEFLVLLQDIEDDTHAYEAARHLNMALKQPYHAEGLELSLSASIGIGVHPRDGENIDVLIMNADAAMYQAKQAGRNEIQFYSQELAAWSQLQLRIEEHLRTALAQNTFQLYYQPLVDMHTRQVLGVEALVRWHRTDIGPSQFVPVAESTGHIGRICDWVIEEACGQFKAWQKNGLPAIPIAINVSAVQLRNKNFVAHFSELLDKCEFAPSALQIEVTETAMMENLDRAVEVLSEFKRLGVQISLDDFGTGYSSLSYLSRLPLDKIKIDKSFVQRIDEDPSSRLITEAVIALGRSLNLEVVAEGIESEETLAYLRDQGCHQAQGYFVCEPKDGMAFERWYSARAGLFGSGQPRH